MARGVVAFEVIVLVNVHGGSPTLCTGGRLLSFRFRCMLGMVRTVTMDADRLGCSATWLPNTKSF